MSLNYDLTKLPKDVAFKPDGGINPVTDAIIWYSMFTGMPGELTEKTIPEFYARMQHIDGLSGPILKNDKGEDYSITVDDLYKRIGMSTDVTNIGLGHIRRGETRAQFMRRIGSDAINRAKYQAKDRIKELKKEKANA